MGHPGSGGLKLLDGLGNPGGKHLTKLHIRHAAVIVLVNTVTRSKQGSHFPDGRLGGLGCPAGEFCKLCYALITQRGNTALNVISSTDELCLCRTCPGVAEVCGCMFKGL